ncbi:patatin-like phospholipase family protein [Priestia aryabhattai]|uniref:patatin-like phospholipase family protein n=1 Tax=Priestia TaxID=2800373 RepID=UPI001EBEDC1E|nr:MULTISPECIES: patatin-like phospholipase family protein [Priestia]MBY0093734.1 patatin-like phospholipase family protein [Priestia aryabhattai]MBY0105019.1 patatin-like phospholipase family protein [Priestia aryabhattai]MCM3305514.1 patatin-like phospholipase family protein [Priestia megaterium]
MGTELEFDSESPHKVGLALSGGGFRAAFFHLGVLSGLAEKGMLKDIEVISTVSGGSIIGALYYLRLKNLLEKKEDHEIKDKDYVSLIEGIEKEFTKGVEKNIRMEAFSNLYKNLKITFKPFSYTRLNYLGELYENYFYKDVAGKSSIEMQDLRIDMASKNPTRQNKAPNLFINSTLLNNGRSWHFTPYEMGQFGEGIKPIKYEDYDNSVYLRDAVAASASVPGIFPSLGLVEKNGYNKYHFKLVDGGVTDNLGIQALIDQNCTHFIISDGSRQLDLVTENKDYAVNKLSTLGRTNDILMSQVTKLQLQDLKGKYTIDHLHLRDDLSGPNINWGINLERGIKKEEWINISKDDFSQAKALSKVEGIKPRDIYTFLDDLNSYKGATCYGIDKKVQHYLSKIRTDLDAFSQIEASSLMMSGYAICKKRTKKSKISLKGKFNFKKIKAYLEKPNDLLIDRLEKRSKKQIQKKSQKAKNSLRNLLLVLWIGCVPAIILHTYSSDSIKFSIIVITLLLNWFISMFFTPFFKVVPYHVIKNILLIFFSILYFFIRKPLNSRFLKKGTLDYLEKCK